MESQHGTMIKHYNYIEKFTDCAKNHLWMNQNKCKMENQNNKQIMSPFFLETSKQIVDATRTICIIIFMFECCKSCLKKKSHFNGICWSLFLRFVIQIPGRRKKK